MSKNKQYQLSEVKALCDASHSRAIFVTIRLSHVETIHLSILYKMLYYLAEGKEAPEEVDNYVPKDGGDLKSYDGYGEVGFQSGQPLPPPPPPTYEDATAPSMEFGQ